jgi:hypothetical protein
MNSFDKSMDVLKHVDIVLYNLLKSRNRPESLRRLCSEEHMKCMDLATDEQHKILALHGIKTRPKECQDVLNEMSGTNNVVLLTNKEQVR